MEPDDLLCSRNAWPPKALVGRAHIRNGPGRPKKVEYSHFPTNAEALWMPQRFMEKPSDLFLADEELIKACH